MKRSKTSLTMPKLLGISALLLFMGACEKLKTDYGDTTGDSVNGFTILTDVWTDEFDTRRSHSLTERTADADTLLHVENKHGIFGSAGLNSDAEVWLEEWFLNGYKRQVVILLQDGNVSEWLLQQWVNELTTTVNKAKAEDQPKLKKQLQNLQNRLNEERTSARLNKDETEAWPWFVVTGATPATPTQGQGPLAGPLPPFLEVRSGLDVSNEDLKPLLTAGGQVIAAEIPAGDDDRVIVVTTTTPFLDAGLVDPKARALFDRLTSYIKDSQNPGDTRWVRWLRQRQHDPSPPNVLAMLIGKWPFNIVIFHLLALLILFIWAKSAWLGRTAAIRDNRLEHFGKHLDAMGDKLRQRNAWNLCLQQVARYWRRPSPDDMPDVDAAMLEVRTTVLEALPEAADPHETEQSFDDDEDDRRPV